MLNKNEISSEIKAVSAVAVTSVKKAAQQKKRAKVFEISDDEVENLAPLKVQKSTVMLKLVHAFCISK